MHNAIPKVLLFITRVGTILEALEGANASALRLQQGGTAPADRGYREAKLLCKKAVGLMRLITSQHSRAAETGVKVQKVTQEQLALVTGCAHYIKLVIRLGLQQSMHSLDDFLRDVSTDTFAAKLNSFTAQASKLAAHLCDLCWKRGENVEEAGLAASEPTMRSWRLNYLKCRTCSVSTAPQTELSSATFEASSPLWGLAHDTKGHRPSWLESYQHLLWVAVARLIQSVNFDVVKLQHLRLEDLVGKEKEPESAIGLARYFPED